jgi:putative peptidoglycan lipid II flippase
MSTRLARSAGLISVATMASRVLGLVRDSVLAAIFGAGMAMDAYNVAFRIPNLFRDLFAEGAMTAAFVPTFTRTLNAHGREAAWRLGNLVINALLLITGALVLVAMIYSDQITYAVVAGNDTIARLLTGSAGSKGFDSVPGKMELTSLLTRMMMPFLTMVAVAVGMMGMLNSLRRFFVPALAPAMFNVATIFCAVAVVPLMPHVGLPPIAGIGIGTLLGGLGQILLQWPLLRREGFRYQPTLDFKDPDLQQILRLMGPGTLGLAAVQINVLVNTYLAAMQEQGAVSWLGYAFRLMYLPIGLVGVSIATAVLPDIARHANAGDHPAMRRTISGALRMMLMLNVPATVGLIVLADPIIAMIFERGHFTPIDTAATAAALMFYAPGLVGYSAVKVASPSFYSLGDARTPVIVSVLSVLANLVINLVLVRVMGYKGLALGTAIAAIFNAGALLLLLRGRIGGLEGRRLAVSFLKILVASILMGTAAWYAAQWLEGALPGRGEFEKGIRVFASIATGLLVLVASARLLRIAEFDEALSRVVRRLLPSAERP